MSVRKKEMVPQKLIRELRGRCPVKQLSIDSQINAHSEALYEELMDIKRYNAYYVKSVLKELIDHADNNNSDIALEWVYEEYMKVLNVAAPAGGDYEDMLEYPLSAGVVVRLWEKPRLISSVSTTGFRTWEAALYLCIYFSECGTVHEGMSFLELGAGTGMVSMYLYKLLQGRCKVYITDGDSQLLDGGMRKNLLLNEIDEGKVVRQRLIWGEDNASMPVDVDMLVGADITYDSTYFGELGGCIRTFLDGGCHEMVISCTVRSEETLRKFCEEIVARGLTIELISDTDEDIVDRMESILYKKLIAPIHIYRITR